HSRFYLGHKVLPAMFCLLYRIPGQCDDRFSCLRAEPPRAFAPRAKSETPPKLSEAPAQNKLWKLAGKLLLSRFRRWRWRRSGWVGRGRVGVRRAWAAQSLFGLGQSWRLAVLPSPP